MKKFFVCLIIVSIIFAAGVAGLSVLPHGHGDDLDHSHHKNCVVYQVTLAGPFVAESAAVFFLVVLVLLWLVFIETAHVTSRQLYFISLRAPPLAS